MAPTPSTDDILNEFLTQRGHETDSPGWEASYNKKQCPDCGGLHDRVATECSACGWRPRDG